MALLPKRFEKSGLTVHPEKTKLVDMRSPATPTGTAPNHEQPDQDQQASPCRQAINWARPGLWGLRVGDHHENLGALKKPSSRALILSFINYNGVKESSP